MDRSNYINKRNIILAAILFFLLTVTIPSLVLAEITKGSTASPDLRTAIAQVAKENIPAVVHIEVTKRQE